eukprot:1160499-Rhodomonas_salina.3
MTQHQSEFEHMVRVVLNVSCAPSCAQVCPPKLESDCVVFVFRFLRVLKSEPGASEPFRISILTCKARWVQEWVERVAL